MVEVAITARNPNDNSIRAWGLSIDKIPTGNWLKDDSVIKTNKKSGELWKTNIDVPDGDHTVYLIISQTPGDLGTYDGEALFDQAGYNFAGVDNDSVAAFDMSVSKGKAKRNKSTPATTGPTDIPGESSPFKSKLGSLSRVATKIKAWERDTWIKAGIVGAVSAVSILVIAVVAKRLKNGNGRRF